MGVAVFSQVSLQHRQRAGFGTRHGVWSPALDSQEVTTPGYEQRAWSSDLGQPHYPREGLAPLWMPLSGKIKNLFSWSWLVTGYLGQKFLRPLVFNALKQQGPWWEAFSLALPPAFHHSLLINPCSVHIQKLSSLNFVSCLIVHRKFNLIQHAFIKHPPCAMHQAMHWAYSHGPQSDSRDVRTVVKVWLKAKSSDRGAEEVDLGWSLSPSPIYPWGTLASSPSRTEWDNYRWIYG